MKKLLTLLSLTLSMTAFANTPVIGSDVGAGQATMGISATVVIPLTVSIDADINFGRILVNTKSAVVPGRFTVSGAPNENVYLTLNGQTLNSFSQSTLNGPGGETMTLFVEDKKVNDSTSIGNNTNLGPNGNLDFTFNAWTQASQNQVSGTYTGSLVLAARYN